jgi:hypothetical protein
MGNRGNAAILAVGMAFAVGVMAAQEGTLIRAADLKAKPQIDAATVKALTENTPLQVLGNDGGWSQVKTNEGSQGWVRLLNVRLPSNGGGSVSSGLASLGNVARTGSKSASATTAAKGSKGFDKEALENATPNPEEVKKLDSYRATDASASAYAKSQKLVARDVPELAKP